MEADLSAAQVSDHPQKVQLRNLAVGAGSAARRAAQVCSLRSAWAQDHGMGASERPAHRGTISAGHRGPKVRDASRDCADRDRRTCHWASSSIRVPNDSRPCPVPCDRRAACYRAVTSSETLAVYDRASDRRTHRSASGVGYHHHIHAADGACSDPHVEHWSHNIDHRIALHLCWRMSSDTLQDCDTTCLLYHRRGPRTCGHHRDAALEEGRHAMLHRHLQYCHTGDRATCCLYVRPGT